MSSEIELAIRVLNIIENATHRQWIDTTYLVNHINEGPNRRQAILRICHRLNDREILAKFGTGKIKWKLVDKEYDRLNPLSKKVVRGGQHEQDEAVPTQPANSEAAEFMAKQIALLTQQVAELASQVASQVKTIELKMNEQPAVKIDGIVHPVFAQVMFHIACGDNVMLVGPKGCGKTTLCEQVAKALELPHAMLSLSGGVTESKLLGRVVPNIQTGANEYHSTSFVDLFEEGGVFLLDEVDAADPNVLLALNSALANGKIALDRAKKPMAHKDEKFVCLAAANTWGSGADRQYVGRNQQDGAFTERFVQISMDYDANMEKSLCADCLALVERLHMFRRRCNENKLQRTISTRVILRAANWLRNGKDMEYVESMVFAGWREDEIRKVKGY